LLFVVPAMLIPAVLLVDEALRARRQLILAVCAATFLLGVSIQIAGASQYWDHFIRMTRTVQVQWLGGPNRAGALTADRGGGCDPCFEDFYARNFTPAFQPIEGQWWYLRHHLRSDAWEVAAKDLPLRRYTSLDFKAVRDWYDNPPWDWWKLDFVGRYKRAGNVLWWLFLTGLLAGAALWGRGMLVAIEPCAETGPCSWPRPWRHLRAFLAPRLGRLRDRLRGRGR